jgi:hypothetical protein
LEGALAVARTLIAATALAAGMSVVVLGCSSGPATTVTGPAPGNRSADRSPAGGPARSARHPARPVTLADARRCPVTIGHPVPGTAWWRTLLFGYGSAYGNGSLWVGGLWPHGVVIVTRDEISPGGRLGMKFGWYRLTSGYLTITGRRLDGPAPPASGLTFRGAYGLTGFNASGVTFPTEGCWQVTGRVGRVSLTFVTFVITGHCHLGAAPPRCVAGRVH